VGRRSLCLRDGRRAAGLLPDGFPNAEFMELLFLTVENYNRFWYNRLQKADMWSDLASRLPR